MQKATVEATHKADRNTRYFYTSTAIQRKLNHIEAMQDMTGQWIINLESVRNMVQEFFLAIYTAEQH